MLLQFYQINIYINFQQITLKKIAIVKKESLLKIIKETEGWLLLESDGVKGWITKNAVWGLN